MDTDVCSRKFRRQHPLGKRENITPSQSVSSVSSSDASLGIGLKSLSGMANRGVKNDIGTATASSQHVRPRMISCCVVRS